MKKYLFFIAVCAAVVFASCEDKKTEKQEVTIEYLEKVTSGTPKEVSKKQVLQLEMGTKINQEYLKAAKLLPEVDGFEVDSVDPKEVVVGKDKVTIKVFYTAKAGKQADITLQYLSTGDETSKELSDKKVVKADIGKTINAESLKTDKLILEIKDYEFDSLDPKELKVTTNATIKVLYKEKK